MSIADALGDLTCSDLDSAVGSLLAAGFRIERISPADDPSEADVAGFGSRFRVRRVEAADVLPARIYLGLENTSDLDSISFPPNWDVIRYDASPVLLLPDMQPELVISRAADADLGVGRAGMLYRDLIPSRHGGRYIASHIHIVDGGPVPDYVHFHRVRFQLIFCARGWAKLVYEDQGEPFIMQAGDAVLQPPEIRHRVLASSDHLEVIEIGCPAEHDTMGEHGFDLPTPVIDAERDFGGQRFVWHQGASGVYEPWDHHGFEARNSGIDRATHGLADVRVARPRSATANRVLDSGGTKTADNLLAPRLLAPRLLLQSHEFRFHFVLEGSTILTIEQQPAVSLSRGDSVSIPAGLRYGFSPSEGLELLDVCVG